MSIFVTLGKGTANGYKDIQAMSERYNSVCSAVQAGGGKVIGCYAIMGHYDYLLITEMPSEKDLMKVLLQKTSDGSTTFETLTAIPIKEFIETLKVV
ncbi:MAG: GYD domain-containing protein [Acidobacteria bacterium]|nr:GYD domain-containing protein [Acidobacteriota bacterium]